MSAVELLIYKEANAVECSGYAYLMIHDGAGMESLPSPNHGMAVLFPVPNHTTETNSYQKYFTPFTFFTLIFLFPAFHKGPGEIRSPATLALSWLSG